MLENDNPAANPNMMICSFRIICIFGGCLETVVGGLSFRHELAEEKPLYEYVKNIAKPEPGMGYIINILFFMGFFSMATIEGLSSKLIYCQNDSNY